MPRTRKPRLRVPPVAYFVEGDTPQAIQAASGRRILISTGKGDSRLSLAEAREMHRALWDAIRRQLQVETYEQAGDVPPKYRRVPHAPA